MKSTKSKLYLLLTIIVLTISLSIAIIYLFRHRTPEELIASKLNVNVESVSVLTQTVNGTFKTTLVEITNANRFFLVMSNDNYKNIVFKEMADQKAIYCFFNTNSNLPNFDGYGVYALINKQRTPLILELLNQKSEPIFSHNTMTNEAFIKSFQVSTEEFSNQTPRIQTKFKDDVTHTYLIELE